MFVVFIYLCLFALFKKQSTQDNSYVNSGSRICHSKMSPWHAVLCLVAQLCPTLCDPVDCSPLGSSVHGDSPGRKTGVSSLSASLEDLPDPGIELGSPALQADSLPAELPGKPLSLAYSLF